MTSFADRLRAARARSDFTQKQVAEALGIATSSLLKWEKATTEPSVSSLKSLAELYEVSIDWLIVGKRLPNVFDQDDES